MDAGEGWGSGMEMKGVAEEEEGAVDMALGVKLAYTIVGNRGL